MKKFHLAHLLSVTGDRILFCAPGNEDYPMRTVREILNYMTSETGINTVALGATADQVEPYLYEQFPFLRNIDARAGMGNANAAFLEKMIAQYGAWHMVRSMPQEDYTPVDPIEEILKVRPDAKFIDLDGSKI